MIIYYVLSIVTMVFFGVYFNTASIKDDGIIGWTITFLFVSLSLGLVYSQIVSIPVLILLGLFGWI